VEGSCEHGNEHSHSIKCWEVLELLHNWQFLEYSSTPRGLLLISVNTWLKKMIALEHKTTQMTLAGDFLPMADQDADFFNQ
jgi:hypothetical protein